MTLKDALDEAVKECIDEHVLEEFFRERGDEVKKVIVLDFTFERRIELEKRDGRIDGKIESVLELLEELGTIPPELEEQIRSQKDEGTLTRWIKLAAKAKSIEDFEQKISKE